MIKKTTLFLSTLFFLLVLPFVGQSQGCIAVRPMGCGGANPSNNTSFLGKGDFQVSALYRYFESYKHYKGDVEQKERVEQGTQVINTVNSVDLSLGYGITNRLSVNVNLPIISYDRSSLYEHYGNSTTANPDQLRFHTDAKGIGDLRLSGSYWMLNPQKHQKGNFALGLGVKAPTGNSNVEGTFHKRTKEGLDSTVVKPVDQSIQLGDGGWGFTVDAQAFKSVFKNGSVYFAGFYMFNPKNQNETLTRGTLVGADPLIAYHSVADQFAVRFGLNYVLPVQGLSINFGPRVEGVPAKDVIGDSEGFRRPGYIVSAEPGISYAHGNLVLAANVPFALYRNRVKSVYDLADPTGVRHGDAAFADYLINVSASYRIGKKHSADHTMPPPAPVFKNAGEKN